MDATRPTQLSGVVLAGVEVTSVEFKMHRRPEKGAKGFLMHALTVKDVFKKGEPTLPGAFEVHGDFKVHAYVGDVPKAGETASKEDELMVCRVEVVVLYRVDEPTVSACELRKCMWYFQSQVGLVAQTYIRGVLHDTAFAALPIVGVA